MGSCSRKVYTGCNATSISVFLFPYPPPSAKGKKGKKKDQSSSDSSPNHENETFFLRIRSDRLGKGGADGGTMGARHCLGRWPQVAPIASKNASIRLYFVRSAIRLLLDHMSCPEAPRPLCHVMDVDSLAKLQGLERAPLGRLHHLVPGPAPGRLESVSVELDLSCRREF